MKVEVSFFIAEVSFFLKALTKKIILYLCNVRVAYSGRDDLFQFYINGY